MSVVAQVQLNTVDGKTVPFNNGAHHQETCPNHFVCKARDIGDKVPYDEGQLRMCCLPNDLGHDTDSTAAEDKGIDPKVSNYWDGYPMYRGVNRDWARDHCHQGDMAPFQGQTAIGSNGKGEFRIDMPYEVEEQHNHAPSLFNGWVLYFACLGKGIKCVTGDVSGAVVIPKELHDKPVVLRVVGPPKTVAFIWFSRRVRWAKPGLEVPVPGPWGLELSYAKLLE
jgi:hypothetical protein